MARDRYRQRVKGVLQAGRPDAAPYGDCVAEGEAATGRETRPLRGIALNQIRRGWPPDIPLRATKGRPYKRGSGKEFPRITIAQSAESKNISRALAG